MPVDCVCRTYQHLITMYIGNYLCDSGRFQCTVDKVHLGCRLNVALIIEEASFYGA